MHVSINVDNTSKWSAWGLRVLNFIGTLYRANIIKYKFLFWLTGISASYVQFEKSEDIFLNYENEK